MSEGKKAAGWRVHLPDDLVGRLDLAIAERNGGILDSLIRGDAFVPDGPLQNRQRRDMLRILIERECHVEALFPTWVRLDVPQRAVKAAGPAGPDNTVMRWREAEQCRLNAEAPEAVKDALRRNELIALALRDPDAFVARMEAAR